MRILYHHRTLAADGMDVHISELTAALRGRGHDVLVVGPPRASSRSGEAGVQSRVLATVRRLLPAALAEPAEVAYNIHAYRRLAAACRTFRPDILYERHNLFMLAGQSIARRYRLPLLLEVNAPLTRERSEHGTLAWPRLARWIETRTWRSADAVLPVSHVLAEVLRQAGVPAERIHVVANGVDPARYSPSVDGRALRQELALHGRLVVGFTGFIRAWHGLDLLIEAMATHGRTHNLHLVVVGDGPARPDLEQQASNLGVRDLVSFTGRVAGRDIPRYLAAFDIAVQPSAVDYASPLKLVEYMAMGKAIIAPDQPNIRELIENRTSGLLVPGGDTEALAGAICELARDAELRRNLGENAAGAVINRGLVWDRNAERIELIAANLLERTLAAAP